MKNAVKMQVHDPTSKKSLLVVFGIIKHKLHKYLYTEVPN